MCIGFVNNLFVIYVWGWNIENWEFREEWKKLVSLIRDLLEGYDRS